MRSKRWRPTPSFAVAMVALVIAMTGGAFAATTAATKKKTTTNVSSLVARDVRAYFNSHRGLFLGPRGAAGVNGTNGKNGINGAAGASGATGAPGPAGATHIQVWHIGTTPGAGGSSGTGVVTLATIGPFTLIGKCTTSSGNTYAFTYLRVGQAHSEIDDYENQGNVHDVGPTSVDGSTTQPGGSNVPGDFQVGDGSSDRLLGSNTSPGFEGTSGGSTSALSGDSATYLDAFSSQGVYIGTTSGANPGASPCLFDGYVMSNTLS